MSTTCAFVPQVLQSYRSRDVSGISLGMYSIFTFGVGMWLIYGIMTRAWPVIIANALTFLLALSILVLKLASLKKRAPQADPGAKAPFGAQHSLRL